MAKDPRDKLLIPIAKLGDQGLAVDETLPREWLDNIPDFSGDEQTHLDERGIEVKVRVLLEGDNLRVRGTVKAELVTICSRCGESMTYQLAGDIDRRLLKGPAPELPVELELTPEDLAREYYLGEELDLSPLLQEEVALLVPVQPLCREDCEGLCPQCGASRNLEKCSCSREATDPRLAALKNIKLN